MSSLRSTWDGNPYGYMKVYCPECKINYGRCTNVEAFRECQKWCESCNGTARIPIPLLEVISGTKNGK